MLTETVADRTGALLVGVSLGVVERESDTVAWCDSPLPVTDSDRVALWLSEGLSEEVSVPLRVWYFVGVRRCDSEMLIVWLGNDRVGVIVTEYVSDIVNACE